MLKGDPNQGLLPAPPSSSAAPPAASSAPVDSPTTSSQISEQPSLAGKGEKRSANKAKKKKERNELTYILKVMNLVVGLVYLGFAVYCYVYGFKDDRFKDKALFMQWLMPAYLGLSGLVILLIECRVGVDSLRCLYNYCGRGLFNIYAGLMPLMLVDDWNQIDTFEILTLVAASLMCLVGLLYIVLKVCCCEKEGRKIDQQNRRRRSRRAPSDSEDDSD